MKLSVTPRDVSTFVAGGTKGEFPGPPMAVYMKLPIYQEEVSSFVVGKTKDEFPGPPMAVINIKKIS